MTLAIVVHIPEGIIMASDSRQSITINSTRPDGVQNPPIDTINSDSAFKTFLLEGKEDPNLQSSLKKPWQVGVSSYGQDMLGGVSIASHLTKFYEEKLGAQETVQSISEKLLDYFSTKFKGAKTGFHVAGYDFVNGISIPFVFVCSVEENTIQRRNLSTEGNVIFGATWSGQIDILASILNPAFHRLPNGQVVEMAKPQIFWDAMQLQDAIDFTIYGIRTTIDTIRFQGRLKNVGGPIDVLAITPENGAFWIQKKKLHGNR